MRGLRQGAVAGAVLMVLGLPLPVALPAGADEPASATSPTAIGEATANRRETAAASAVPEPSGFRMDDYRSPTPASLSGATVVDTAAAKRLFETKAAVFIDVLPRAPKPKGLPAGTVWHPKPRSDIPGSVWLVDTGYGALPPAMEAYFRDGLARATCGDKTKPLLFYCLRDCWMSWNAAKRAIAAGYSGVLWYPEGTDGWTAAGLPLEPREPEKRPDE